jgi:hypothetical protein
MFFIGRRLPHLRGTGDVVRRVVLGAEGGGGRHRSGRT